MRWVLPIVPQLLSTRESRKNLLYTAFGASSSALDNARSPAESVYVKIVDVDYARRFSSLEFSTPFDAGDSSAVRSKRKSTGEL